MIKHQAGDSRSLAEIIIDYKKKDVKILNPIKRNKIRDTDLNFSLSPIFLIICIPILFILIVIPSEFKLFPQSLLHFGIFVFSLLITSYLVAIILTPLRKKFHQFEQFLFNDYFMKKKLVITTNIKGKIWQLPYKFNNLKLEYKLFGDFAKYISKVHIKPKDYFIKQFKKVEKQTEEWDCFFYFSKHPKNGKMEIEFI